MKKLISIYKQYKEVINYLFFGVLSTIISLAVYYGLTFTILDPEVSLELQIANFFSWLCAIIFAYITNRKYVFNSKNKNLKREITSFVGARIITLLMDMLIMYVGVTLLHGNDKLLKIVSQVVVIVSNYLFSKIIVFKRN